MARLLYEAGKPVVAWSESDVPDELRRIRDNKHCAALVIYPDDDRHNLEAALSLACDLDVLATGMQLVAETRGYSWEDQLADLLSRCEGATPEQREIMKAADTVAAVLHALPEREARRLVRLALAAARAAPFEIKGARPARLLAETIVDRTEVPQLFKDAMVALDAWMSAGCQSCCEVAMG